MNCTDVIKIINETYFVDAEYLWDGETHAVFRHPASKKWFGIIMEVKKKNLHLAGYENSVETEDAIRKLIDESWNLVKAKIKMGMKNNERKTDFTE